MGENRATDGELALTERAKINRLPGESPEAYAAFKAYCELPPDKRTLAAAYHSLTGKGEKVPGHFGRWSARFQWRERSAAWDMFFDQLQTVRSTERLEAARRETVEETEALMRMLKSEIRSLERQSNRFRPDPEQESARREALRDLAAALRDVSATRIAALGGGETE